MLVICSFKMDEIDYHEINSMMDRCVEFIYAKLVFELIKPLIYCNQCLTIEQIGNCLDHVSNEVDRHKVYEHWLTETTDRNIPDNILLIYLLKLRCGHWWRIKHSRT